MRDKREKMGPTRQDQVSRKEMKDGGRCHNPLVMNAPSQSNLPWRYWGSGSLSRAYISYTRATSLYFLEVWSMESSFLKTEWYRTVI